MNNGITMSPQPTVISPGIVALLGDTVSPYFAHNEWDWIQVQTYGFNGAVVTGDGNTPFGYGSPVAGLDTHYAFEATDVTASGDNTFTIELNDVIGPWRRIREPATCSRRAEARGGSTGSRTPGLPVRRRWRANCSGSWSE